MQNSSGLPPGNSYQGMMGGGPAVTYSNQYEDQMQQANSYHYQQPQQQPPPQQYRPPMHHYNNSRGGGGGGGGHYQYYANQDHQYGAVYPERHPKMWQSANGPRPYRNPWVQPPSPLHSLQKMVLQDGGNAMMNAADMGYFPSSDAPGSDSRNNPPPYSQPPYYNKLSPSYSHIPATPSIDDIIQPITSDHFPSKQEAEVTRKIPPNPNFPTEKQHPDSFGPPSLGDGGITRFESPEKETVKEPNIMPNCSFDRKDSQLKVPEACSEKKLASESQAPKLNHLPLSYNSPSSSHDTYTNFASPPSSESFLKSGEVNHNLPPSCKSTVNVNPSLSCKVNMAASTQPSPQACGANILQAPNINSSLQPVATQSSLNTTNSMNVPQTCSRMPINLPHLTTTAIPNTYPAQGSATAPNTTVGPITYGEPSTTVSQAYQSPQTHFAASPRSTMQACNPSNTIATHTFNLTNPNIPQSPINTTLPHPVYDVAGTNPQNSGAATTTISQIGNASSTTSIIPPVSSSTSMVDPPNGKGALGNNQQTYINSNTSQPLSSNANTPQISNIESISHNRLSPSNSNISQTFNVPSSLLSCNPSNAVPLSCVKSPPLASSSCTPSSTVTQEGISNPKPTVPAPQPIPTASSQPDTTNDTMTASSSSESPQTQPDCSTPTVSSTSDQATSPKEATLVKLPSPQSSTPTSSSGNLHIVHVTAQSNPDSTEVEKVSSPISSKDSKEEKLPINPKSPLLSQDSESSPMEKSPGNIRNSPLIIELRSSPKPEASLEVPKDISEKLIADKVEIGSTNNRPPLLEADKSQSIVDIAQNKGSPCIINVNKSSPTNHGKILVNTEVSHSDQVSSSSCPQATCDISKDSIAHDDSNVEQDKGETDVLSENTNEKEICENEKDEVQKPHKELESKSPISTTFATDIGSQEDEHKEEVEKKESNNIMEESVPSQLETNAAPLPKYSDIKVELDSEDDSAKPRISQPRKKKVTKKTAAKTKVTTKGKQRKPPPPSPVPLKKQPKKSLKKRGSKELAPVEAEAPKFKKLRHSGPYIHVEGSRQRPTSISVVNLSNSKSDRDEGKPPGKLDKSDRRGVIHTSTLSPNYDAVTRDRTWLCVFCHQGSHFHTLGDLYGPYYTEGMPVPPAAIKTEPKVTTPRVIRSKRKRSELVEEFFKSKKSKQHQQTGQAGQQSASRKSVSIQTDNWDREPARVPMEMWVHEECASWTPGIFLSGLRVHGLEEAVSEAATQNCSRCKLNGATLACVTRGCRETYHYTCAIHGCEMNDINFTIHCPKHKHRTLLHHPATASRPGPSKRLPVSRSVPRVKAEP